MTTPQPVSGSAIRGDTPDSEALAMELAETTDLSPKQARELIARLGNDRAALLKAARNFKAES